MSYLLEITNPVIAIEVADYTSAPGVPDIVSMKNYNKCLILIQTGAWAAGTAAVTISECTAISGAAGAQDLEFEIMYSKLNTASAFTQNAVTADTFNLSAADTIYAIEIKTGDLTVEDGYDCIRLNVASPGANADFYGAQYIMYEPRHADATQADAIAD